MACAYPWQRWPAHWSHSCAGALWWRPRWRTVACVGLLTAALAAVGGCLLRVESFYGNLIPRLTWRWTPTAEEQFASWQTSGQHATAPTAQHVTPETPAVTADRDHPGFLGAERDGVVRGVQLDADWAHRPPRELWRRPVGLGWSGFAVAGRLAVTQEQRGPQESVVCYDLLTGAERWIHVDDVRFADEHGDGPRATPTLVGGRVFTLGGTGLLNCLDAQSGQLIWQQQVLAQPDQQNLLWGMSGSPLVVDDRVVVTPGGGPGRAVMAFACRDGRPVWSRGDDPAAYASPAVVQLAGQTQLLSFNGAGVRGFALTDGQPLWLCPWITQGERQRVNVAQPLVVTFADAAASHDEGFVLVSSGYEMGTARAARLAAAGQLAGCRGLAQPAAQVEDVQLRRARRLHLWFRQRHSHLPGSARRSADVEAGPIRTRPAAAGRRPVVDPGGNG